MSGATPGSPRIATRGSRRVALGALVVWGVLHVFGGLSLLVAAAGDGANAGLESLTGQERVPAVPGVAGTLTEAVLVFLAIVLALAGVAVAFVALTRSRHAWPLGVSGALGIVAVLDAALVVALLIPGHIAISVGVWGPGLLVIAVVAAWNAGWRPVQQ